MSAMHEPSAPATRQRNELFEYTFQALDRFLRVRVIKLLLLQPAQITHRPAVLARIDTIVLEHEGAYLLPVHTRCLDCRRSSANEIVSGPMPFVRNQTAVSSPARNRLASESASPRFVSTRSPGFLGISKGRDHGALVAIGSSDRDRSRWTRLHNRNARD
ncbi:hypothetical protein LPU83_pLPU83b_0180 (plasmid) [Rhizobium favelukesii]|uniref:Uncharacterized protein n=1 Tax=Rhizobium favelukesii TaxID=348824 RepID=W6RIK4_9HYPH|nr:hypothetical protein LPU83_pLPU83b_0180 [Rhizobium favelukesii]